jgi:hypothetical protein
MGISNELPRDQRRRRRPAGAACDLGAVEADGATVPAANPYDLDGDGRADLTWRDRFGNNATWTMNGSVPTAAAFLPTVGDLAWQIVGSGDFDGDGHADLFWRNGVSGENAIWLMDGLTLREGRYLPVTPEFGGRRWRLASLGDFDGDGRTDLLWERRWSDSQANPPFGSDGVTMLWLLDGGAIKGARMLPLTGIGLWTPVGAGDVDGNGTADILWRGALGGTGLWLMANGDLVQAITLPTVADPDWTIAAVNDISGDGSADLVWRHRVFGLTAAWLLQGSTLAGFANLPTVSPEQWTLIRASDTDGDGRADLLWRARTGATARWQMNGLTIQSADLLTPSPDPSWELQ